MLQRPGDLSPSPGEVPCGAGAALGQRAAIVTGWAGVSAHSVTYKYILSYVFRCWAIYSIENTVTSVYLRLNSKSNRGFNVFFLLSSGTTNCCWKLKLILCVICS